MTNPQDAQSLLMGGGGRNWSWVAKDANGIRVDKPVGTSISGTVEASGISEMQQTDYDTGALLTWPDGKPKMQIVIPLQTQFKDDDEDDGRRTLYVKQSSNLQAAIANAVRATGAKALEDGGTLTVTFTGTKPASNPRNNPIKVFSAQYQRSAGQQGALMDGQPQTVATAPAVTAPQPTVANPVGNAPVDPHQPTVSNPSGVPPETVAVVKGLLGMGKSAQEVAAVTGLTVDQINQLPPF